jgi:hypothetical protein
MRYEGGAEVFGAYTGSCQSSCGARAARGDAGVERRRVMTELPEALKSVSPNYPDDYLKGAERDAARWAAISDGALIGIIGAHGSDVVRDACSAEMQRRVVISLRAFSADASTQTGRLITLAEETGRQTDKVISLTLKLEKLTVLLAWLAGLAALLAAVPAVEILVRFYRWYRGWL